MDAVRVNKEVYHLAQTVSCKPFPQSHGPADDGHNRPPVQCRHVTQPHQRASHMPRTELRWGVDRPAAVPHTRDGMNGGWFDLSIDLHKVILLTLICPKQRRSLLTSYMGGDGGSLL